MDHNLQNSIRSLPDSPGVYKFFDKNKKLLYIGKAKSLKKRVSSYFNKRRYESAKIKVLVNKIVSIEHILVESEADALLLENNLIKKHQPRYNVNLKDDKTFPWICVRNETFPRVFSTRNIVKDGSKYYGPYTSAHTVRTLLNLIRELYMLRNCKLDLKQEKIKAGKFKVCLEYHLKNCKGPCEGLQSEQDYNETIDQVNNILKGNLSDVIAYLKKLMNKLSGEYRYEEAESIKNKITALEKFQMKSTIVSPHLHDIEVYSIVSDERNAAVNFLKLNNGAIIQAHTVEIRKKLDETEEEILAYAIFEIRERLNTSGKEIILPFRIPELENSLKLSVPKQGERKKLLQLSERNAKFFLLEKRKSKTQNRSLIALERVLNTVKKDLHLTELPVHIECFDNSNIQGTHPVAACVVFRNLKPSKKDYRHYNIKTVAGANDFASMYEVVFRRYSRLVKEGKELPQLIIVDGGKGQLSAAVKGLEALNLRNKVAIIGIAKKLEEIYFPEDSVPLYLDKNSETLTLIQHLRNEAHRFGITFHRQKRSNHMLKSSLESIKGIGTKSIEMLISEFKSIEKLNAASHDEISKVVGRSKANLLADYLKNKPD